MYGCLYGGILRFVFPGTDSKYLANAFATFLLPSICFPSVSFTIDGRDFLCLVCSNAKFIPLHIFFELFLNFSKYSLKYCFLFLRFIAVVCLFSASYTFLFISVGILILLVNALFFFLVVSSSLLHIHGLSKYFFILLLGFCHIVPVYKYLDFQRLRQGRVHDRLVYPSCMHN